MRTGGRVAVGDRYEELPFEPAEAAARAAASRAAASAPPHRRLP